MIAHIKFYSISIFLIFFSLVTTISAQTRNTVGAKPIVINQTTSGELWLEVQLNNLKGKMLVDTGSSSSVIRTEFLEKLRDYKYVGKESGYGVGEGDTEIESNIIRVKQFYIAGHQTELNQINVHSIGLPDKSFIGIIGLDALHAIAKGIYFNGDSVTLLQSPPKKDNAISAKLYRSELGMFYLKSTINKHNIGFIIDSGSPYSLLSHKEAKKLSITTSVLEGAFAEDIKGNKVPVLITEKITLSIKKQALPIEKMLVTSISSLLEHDQYQFNVVGVLGLETLTQSQAWIDFSADTISLSIKQS